MVYQKELIIQFHTIKHYLMYKIIKIILVISLLSSCSATWHLRRAIKKDPSIVTTTTIETIKVIKDSGHAVIKIGRDTTIVDSLITINVKYDSNGLSNLTWVLKEIPVRIVTKTVTIVPPKTRQEIRQKEKTKRYEAKQHAKIAKAEIKNNSKKFKKARNSIIYWAIIIVIIAIVYALYRIKKLLIF